MFRIWGKVLVLETGSGISNLLVSFYRLEEDDSSKQSGKIGSTLTQKDGTFEFEHETDLLKKDGKCSYLQIIVTTQSLTDKKQSFDEIILYKSNLIDLLEISEWGVNEAYLIQITQKELQNIQDSTLEPQLENILQFSALDFEITPELLKEQLYLRKNKFEALASVLSEFTAAEKEEEAKIAEQVSRAFYEFKHFKSQHLSNYYIDPINKDDAKSIEELYGSISDEVKTDLSNVKKPIEFSFSKHRSTNNNWFGEKIESLAPGESTNLNGEEFKVLYSTHAESHIEEESKFSLSKLDKCQAAESFSIDTTTDDTTDEVLLYQVSSDLNYENEDFVKQEIAKQFSQNTSPETHLSYVSPRTGDFINDGSRVNETIPAFELRGGPADVTAYYDFFEIKLALPHIWTATFNGKIKGMGMNLYNLFVRIKDVQIKTISDENDIIKLLKEASDHITLHEKTSVSSIPDSVATVLETDVNISKWQTISDENKELIEIKCEEYLRILNLSNSKLKKRLFREGDWPPGGEPNYRYFYLTPDGERVYVNRMDLIATKNYLVEDDTEYALIQEHSIDKSSLERKRSQIINLLLSFPGDDSISNLKTLLSELNNELNEKYKFDIFVPNTINYGLLLNYRQRWDPEAYQVGELVKTIPLAPNESRKYSTKIKQKIFESRKELNEANSLFRSDTSTTTKYQSEAVNKAKKSTSFEQSLDTNLTYGIFSASTNTKFGLNSDKESQSTKKNFRESVIKNIEEIKNQRKLEIETKTETDIEHLESGEISNPNDEITVTYLFYELQRRFQVSEKLHKVTNVIFVANDVPNPDEIDKDWLLRYSWILKRIILDEEFIEPLDLLEQSDLASQISVESLKANYEIQLDILKEQQESLREQRRRTEEIHDLLMLVKDGPGLTKDERMEILDKLPLETITKSSTSFGWKPGDIPGLHRKTRKITRPNLPDVEVTQEEYDRLQKLVAESESEIDATMNALDKAKNDYLSALNERFNIETNIAKLRIHIKDNILYYMQGIWDHEPPDQRYFRLYNVDVPWPTCELKEIEITRPLSAKTRFTAFTSGEIFSDMDLANHTRKLGEIADIDNLLGYKGNYMIFPVREPNCLHEFMILDYVDPETAGVKDPDDLANYDPIEIEKYKQCLEQHYPERFEEEKQELEDILDRLKNTNRKLSERIIVPTDSLFIEALPGKHPLLEDFKLVHRAIDVKKKQAEVRAEELENIRKASRLLSGEREDPDVEKNIQVSSIDAEVDITP